MKYPNIKNILTAINSPRYETIAYGANQNNYYINQIIMTIVLVELVVRIGVTIIIQKEVKEAFSRMKKPPRKHRISTTI